MYRFDEEEMTTDEQTPAAPPTLPTSAELRHLRRMFRLALDINRANEVIHRSYCDDEESKPSKRQAEVARKAKDYAEALLLATAGNLAEANPQPPVVAVMNTEDSYLACLEERFTDDPLHPRFVKQHMQAARANGALVIPGRTWRRIKMLAMAVTVTVIVCFAVVLYLSGTAPIKVPLEAENTSDSIAADSLVPRPAVQPRGGRKLQLSDRTTATMRPITNQQRDTEREGLFVEQRTFNAQENR